MAFYDLSKDDRTALTAKINSDLREEFKSSKKDVMHGYFSHDDTYIRKTAYTAIGRAYNIHLEFRSSLLLKLSSLLNDEDFKVRQSTVNAAGEIGKKHFSQVENIFDIGLFDAHPSVRNAVIGSIKKMGEVNPIPVLAWARKYLHHLDKEVRREICHGIELRGRTHPQDILPLLEELQHDRTTRVRKTLVHVLGQISYKKGCLSTVLTALQQWNNKQLVSDALQEIIDVHERYEKFSAMSQDEAIKYINVYFKQHWPRD
ncbi:MAG TPA: HEAT repeat domain-containing protein [Cytophagales bacterium]|nr:HEAT repeat domain-containing protein [Cytophagales bacterium]